jgi:predicted ester cyclase
MSADIKSLARKTIDEMFDRGHPTFLADISELSFIGHDPTNPRSLSLGEEEQIAVGFREGFPDLRCDVLDCVTEGDRVMCRWRMRGTHRGPFLGFAATGRGVQFDGLTEMRFHGSRLAEQWTLYDCFGLLHQLGVLPSLGELAERRARMSADEGNEDLGEEPRPM